MATIDPGLIQAAIAEGRLTYSRYHHPAVNTAAEILDIVSHEGAITLGAIAIRTHKHINTIRQYWRILADLGIVEAEKLPSNGSPLLISIKTS